MTVHSKFCTPSFTILHYYCKRGKPAKCHYTPFSIQIFTLFQKKYEIHKEYTTSQYFKNFRLISYPFHAKPLPLGSYQQYAASDIICVEIWPLFIFLKIWTWCGNQKDGEQGIDFVILPYFVWHLVMWKERIGCVIREIEGTRPRKKGARFHCSGVAGWYCLATKTISSTRLNFLYLNFVYGFIWVLSKYPPPLTHFQPSF